PSSFPYTTLCRSHGPAVGRERASEIEPDQPDEPVPVLDRQGLVEPVLFAQHLLGLSARVRAEIAGVEVDRIARRQVDDQEGDERDAEEERNGDQHPTQDVPEHGRAIIAPWLAGGVALQAPWNEPLREVEADPVR